MALLAKTVQLKDVLACSAQGPMQPALQPTADYAATDNAEGGPRTSDHAPVHSVEAINVDTADTTDEASARPFPVLTEMDHALSDVEAEPAANRGTCSSADTAVALLTPSTPRARRRRSSSQQPIIPHRVEDEDAPEDPFNAPTFQDCLKQAQGEIAKLAVILGSSALRQEEGSTLRQLQLEAAALAGFKCPTKRTVAFVGSSGAGKSSLLNCLLDRNGLSRTSNGGQACTRVVTEYHYHESHSYSIKAELWTEEELMDQLLNKLQFYRHFVLRFDDLDHIEQEDCEERASLAIDTFGSMFRLDDWDFLVTDSEADVLERFRGWVSKIYPPQSSEEESGLSFKDCAARLARLGSDQGPADTTPIWPYLRKIKVFVNAHILSKGLVLADLPGLDLNSARGNITERFLRECDEIFVVCNIGGATTDASVESVFKLAQKAMLTKVSIVCTRSDDINAEEAIKDLPERLADLQYRATDELVYRALSKSLYFKLEKLLITTRNKIVIQKLRKLYDGRLGQSTLEVHCVSNELYWTNRNEGRDMYMSFLNLSGIPTIRKHCISIISATQHQAASRYIKHEIPALVAKVELLVQSGAGTLDAERKQHIAHVCNEIEEKLAASLHPRPSHLLSRRLQQYFDAKIYLLHRVPDWDAEAADIVSSWQEWHHTTYAAFCHRYGHLCTPSVGEHNWNEEIIQPMVDELTGPWNKLRASWSCERDSITDYIDTQISETISYLEIDLGYSAPAVRSLRCVLQNERSILLSQVALAFGTFESALENLRVDMLSGTRTAFVGDAMEEAYRESRQQFGRGGDARRKAIIHAAVVNANLIDGIVQRARDGFVRIVNELARLTLDSLESFLEKLRSSLDIIRHQNAVQESEADPAFRQQV